MYSVFQTALRLRTQDIQQIRFANLSSLLANLYLKNKDLDIIFKGFIEANPVTLPILEVAIHLGRISRVEHRCDPAVPPDFFTRLYDEIVDRIRSDNDFPIIFSVPFKRAKVQNLLFAVLSFVSEDLFTLNDVQVLLPLSFSHEKPPKGEVKDILKLKLHFDLESEIPESFNLPLEFANDFPFSEIHRIVSGLSDRTFKAVSGDLLDKSCPGAESDQTHAFLVRLVDLDVKLKNSRIRSFLDRMNPSLISREQWVWLRKYDFYYQRNSLSELKIGIT
jgi:hypothetical protein